MHFFVFDSDARLELERNDRRTAWVSANTSGFAFLLLSSPNTAADVSAGMRRASFLVRKKLTGAGVSVELKVFRVKTLDEALTQRVQSMVKATTKRADFCLCHTKCFGGKLKLFFFRGTPIKASELDRTIISSFFSTRLNCSAFFSLSQR